MSRRAERKLREMGVKVRLNSLVREMEEGAVLISAKSVSPPPTSSGRPESRGHRRRNG